MGHAVKLPMTSTKYAGARAWQESWGIYRPFELCPDCKFKTLFFF